MTSAYQILHLFATAIATIILEAQELLLAIEYNLTIVVKSIQISKCNILTEVLLLLLVLLLVRTHGGGAEPTARRRQER